MKEENKEEPIKIEEAKVESDPLDRFLRRGPSAADPEEGNISDLDDEPPSFRPFELGPPHMRERQRQRFEQMRNRD